MSEERNQVNCPDYLPIYVAINRFTHWLNHADLDNEQRERLLAIGKEYGFDVRKPLEGEEGWR